MIIKLKDILFHIIYILILIYLVIFIPTIWGHKPLVVISGSMEPTLKVGGILYYEKIDMNDFDRGDILVYKTKDHIISHRIIDEVDEGFVTKGDANPSIDSNIIKRTQVLGKGTDWSIPILGYYADFIYNHKYLLYVSVALVSIDLFNDWYVNFKKRKYEETTKKE